MTAFNWDDLRILLALDRAGTLLGAARLLGVSHTTVARRLAAAEAALQTRLFQRQGQLLIRSSAAEEVLDHAHRIEEQVASFSEAAAGADARLEGEVRLTAPMALFTHYLPERLAAFHKAYPGISLTLLGDVPLDSMLRGDADIGLRISRPVSERLDIRRLSGLRFALYGTPDLAARAEDALRRTGRPGRLPYLLVDEKHDTLPELLWMSELFRGQEPALRASTTPILWAAAEAGLGVAALPSFLGDLAPKLRRIAVEPEGPAEKLYLVTKREQRGVAKVRAVVEFLVRTTNADRVLLQGDATRPPPPEAE